ncbi:MAG: hypothetical protein PVH54_11875 [Gammaproteobacteria bacterium]|jgi:hypothetical protein
MLKRIATRVLPAVVFLSLLATGAAQAFCFLKHNDRRADFSSYPIPAIGFSPAYYRDYPYGTLQPAWYEGQRSIMPQQPSRYEDRYGAGSDLRY